MTINEVDKFLQSYIKSKRRYNSILLDVEEIETQIAGLSIDYTKEKVQSSPGDRLTNSIDRLNYLHKECTRILEECTNDMEQVFYTINNVKDSELHELLTRRYIAGQVWEQIAVEMAYTNRHIYKLRQRALEEVRKYCE